MKSRSSVAVNRSRPGRPTPTNAGKLRHTCPTSAGFTSTAHVGDAPMATSPLTGPSHSGKAITSTRWRPVLAELCVCRIRR
jgi:hypothetical protein